MIRQLPLPRRRSATSGIAVALLALHLAAMPVAALTFDPEHRVRLPGGSLGAHPVEVSGPIAHFISSGERPGEGDSYVPAGDVIYTRRDLRTGPTPSVTLQAPGRYLYTAVGVAANGPLVIALYQGADSTGYAGLWVRRSTDGGITWRTRQLLGEDAGSADIAISASHVLVAWIDRSNGAVYYRRSLDDGATYKNVRQLGRVADASMAAVRVAASAQAAYVAWKTPVGGLVMRRSSDAALNWAAAQTVAASNVVRHSITPTPSRVLIVYERADGSLVAAESSDAGVTVRRRYVVQASPDVGYRLCAVDMTRTVARVAYRPSAGGDGAIWVRESFDGGAHWTGPVLALVGIPGYDLHHVPVSCSLSTSSSHAVVLDSALDREFGEPYDRENAYTVGTS